MSLVVHLYGHVLNYMTNIVHFLVCIEGHHVRLVEFVLLLGLHLIYTPVFGLQGPHVVGFIESSVQSSGIPHMILQAAVGVIEVFYLVIFDIRAQVELCQRQELAVV